MTSLAGRPVSLPVFLLSAGLANRGKKGKDGGNCSWMLLAHFQELSKKLAHPGLDLGVNESSGEEGYENQNEQEVVWDEHVIEEYHRADNYQRYDKISGH